MNSQYSQYFIDFLNNNNNFNDGINQDFFNKIKQSHNPHIIIIYGNPRIGKSTFLNQLLKGFNEKYNYPDNEYFNLSGPFKVGPNQSEYITKGCNIYGSIKLSELLKKNCLNNLNINENEDADLFIVDSEGIGSLDNNSSGFISGILTLLQVSTIKIYYTDGVISGNLRETEKLINISQIIQDNNDFSQQTFMVIRNTNIDNRLNEKNQILNALEKNRSEIQNQLKRNLNDRTISDKIHLFCLPNFISARSDPENEKAYKQSMKNITEVMANTILIKNSNSNNLINEINSFKEIFSKITSLNQLNNLREACQKIFEKKAEEYLRKIENIINTSINNMDNKIFRYCENVDRTYNYIKDLISRRAEFEILNKAIPQELKLLTQNLAYIIYCNIDDKRRDLKKNQQLEIKNSIKDKNINKLINIIEKCYYQEEITDIKINECYEDFKSTIKTNFDTFFKLYSNDINSFYQYLKENYIISAKILISNKPEWRIKLDNHFDLPEIKQMKNNICTINNRAQLERFKNNQYADFYNELYYLRTKYGFQIFNENDYIKKIEKAIKEIKNEIDNQINRIILTEFQNNNNNYQAIINDLIEEIKSQERSYNERIKNLTMEMKNLQTKTGNINEENRIIQILIEKISLKEKLEEERMAKINDLTNQIEELKNKIPIPEPKPAPIVHENPPPPPPPVIVQYFPRTPYEGVSIVDGLEAIGHEHSYDYRCKIAAVNNIQNYTGQPEQNLYMLKLLKNGQLIKP